jgi:hypothetical protein
MDDARVGVLCHVMTSSVGIASSEKNVPMQRQISMISGLQPPPCWPASLDHYAR